MRGNEGGKVEEVRGTALGKMRRVEVGKTMGTGDGKEGKYGNKGWGIDG